MQGGETHRYSVPLASGQYVHIVIRQLGVDVIPSFFDPQGNKLVESDTPTENFGSEVIRWIAATAGTYRLEVQSFAKDALPGCYELRLEALRPAAAADRTLVGAELAFADAWRFEQLEDATSQRRALEKYWEAFALFRRGGDLGREALSLDCVAAKHAALGEYPTALDLFEEALRLGRAAGDASVEGHTLFEMGTIETVIGEISPAITHHEGAVSIERNLGNVAMEAEVLSSLGRLRDSLGEKDGALEAYQRALSLSREIRDHDLEIRTLNRLASLHRSWNEKTKALNSYTQALALVRAGPNRALEALILSGLARVLRELGDSERALQNLSRALEMARTAGDRHAEAAIVFEIGRTQIASGNDAKALEQFSKALPLARAVSDPRLEGAVLNASGELLARAGRVDDALSFFDRGLAIAEGTRDPYRKADILVSRGSLLGRSGRFEQGHEALREAILMRRRLGDKLGEAEASYQIALLERNRGNSKEARALAEAAMDAAESVRGRITVPELKASFLGSVQKYYDLEIDLLMGESGEHRRRLVSQAFEASERSKARTLLELLTEAGADIRTGVPEELLERERSLRQRLRAGIEHQVRIPGESLLEPELERLASEMEALTGELQQVEDEIRESSPRYASLTQPRALDLSGVQTETLDADTTLLEYSLGEARSFLFVVTRNSLSAFVLPPRKQIEDAARGIYKHWESGRLTSASARAARAWREAEKLSRMVLGPAAKLLMSKRLLIVSDGALQLIPFAALPWPATAADARRGSTLIDDHEVVHLPSASVLAIQRRELAARVPPAKTLAVLADPVFEREDSRFGRTASQEEVRDGRQRSGERAAEIGTSSVTDLALAEGGLQLARLPQTRREARAILRLVPPSNRKEALDFAASVATVKSEEIANYRYLHFATHGLINSLHPELSGIVLSLFDPEGREQEGFLSTLDVFNLKLPADLVVLSACRTGLGKEIRGEGLVGLTRAFMYAGATRVVASLWKVDDAATAELMKRFYEGMLGPERLTPAAALRRAQIAVKRQKRWQHPFYWAAFTLQGEGT